MANPVVEALTPATHSFATVGDSYDFEVRATDTDTVAGVQTFQCIFEVVDTAGNTIPITLTAEVPTLTPETLTWQEPENIPAEFTAELIATVTGNPATATYRVTRVA